MDRNKALRGNARALRKHMTKEEAYLWYHFLCRYPLRFRRQYIIGEYIADFYCHKAKLVVELDGSQHYETQNRAADVKRDQYLSQTGCKVLRYSNADINTRFSGVCEDILRHLDITDSP